MSDEEKKESPPAAPEISKDQAHQAFQVIVEAIDLAMTGRFPNGIQNVEKLMMIKSSVNVLGETMKQHFNIAQEDVQMAAGSAATEEVAASKEATPKE